jgi:hypothetical protein
MQRIFSSKFKPLAAIGFFGKFFSIWPLFCFCILLRYVETCVMLLLGSILYERTLTKLLNGAIYLQNKSLDKDTWGMI